MTDVDKPAVYCSTSGTFFTDKDELAEHYKSDFHRYNLKRKIAGLPPVTKEWFDARKQQLSGTTALAAERIWVDRLTKKRFGSENTYNAYTRSRKYQDLVRKSGQPAPAPFVTIKRIEDPGTEVRQNSSTAQPRTHTVKPPNKPMHLGEEDPEDDSDWETASEDEEMGRAEAGTASTSGNDGPAEEWDVRKSLFDNHMSDSLEANLEYMWKRFGFYLPDAEYLADPEGLVKYLGAKVAEGHIPLYASGLDENVKQFASLHATQRHMVDTNQCKMVYDGVEEEYEDYYDYSKLLAEMQEAEDPEGGDAVAVGLAEPAAPATAGYERALPDQDGRGGKVLGSREFVRYYRQNHKWQDTRRSVHVNMLQQRYSLLKYRNLGVALIESPGEVQAKRAVRQAQKLQKKGDRIRLRTDLQTNVNRNLPRNVTY